jgi:hypothetical protein
MTAYDVRGRKIAEKKTKNIDRKVHRIGHRYFDAGTLEPLA